MPAVLTYPGVYVEELPSGSHTITGVATSITAFVGRAPKGPTDLPMTIFNFGEYQRSYGGLASGYPLSYAVQDFFMNGGSQAIICRVTATPSNSNKAGSTAAASVAAAVATAWAEHVPEDDTATQKAKDAAAAPNDTAKATEAATAAKAAATAHASKATAAATTAVGTATSAAHTAFPNDADAAAAATKAATAVSTAAAKAAALDPMGDVVAAARRVAVANAVAKAATGTVNGLVLEAANPGAWGNNVSVWIDTKNIKGQDLADAVAPYGLRLSDLFNLTIAYVQPNGSPLIERFINLSVTGDTAPHRVDRVLASESVLVRVPNDAATNDPNLPAVPPQASSMKTDKNGHPTTEPVTTPLSGGADGPLLQTTDYMGDQSQKTGMYMLEHADLFNLLCIPPDVRSEDTDNEVLDQAAQYCASRRAMLIIDPPAAWAGKARQGQLSALDPSSFGIGGEIARAAAVYFPRIVKEDVLMRNQLDVFPACGAIAGIFAATDVQSGVWKAPAGLDAGLTGVAGLEVTLTDNENGQLNPLGINCLRTFPVVGSVVWGARTLRGADQLSDDYKYVPVRRLTDYIEESLYRGTKWAVFQPNAEPLWSSLRLSIGAFMADLSRQGAFYGYKVVCDKTTTSQNDIDNGVVKVLVMFAPVKPAEFVVLQFQQAAGQIPA